MAGLETRARGGLEKLRIRPKARMMGGITKGRRVKNSMKGFALGTLRCIQMAVGTMRRRPATTVKAAISREKPKVLRNWGSAKTCS